MRREKIEVARRWYAIHTLPNQENRAYCNLQAWDVEAFAPVLQSRRVNPFSGARYYVTKPLFSRYIFARFDVNVLLHKVNFTRGVSSVIGFGGHSTPIADEIIEILQHQVGNDGYIKIGETLNYGDQVIIKEGPLKNFIGIFKREVNQSERVRILLMAISYQSHVEIERELVKKIS